MIQLKLFLCADSSAIDARTNTVSAFHILEQINSATFPMVVPRLSIIATLTREEEDGADQQLRLEIFCGDQQLYSGPFPLNFNQLTARAVVELQGFVVPAPQPVCLLFKYNQETLGTWTIKVNKVGHTPVQMSFHETKEPTNAK